MLAVFLPPHAIAELLHHGNKFLATCASLHRVLNGGTQTEFPALAFTARTVLACANRFCFALTEGREDGKSVRQTNFIIDVTQALDVVSVLVELLAGVGMHRVNDKVIVHVVAIEMKRNHHAVSRPRTTGELQAHLDDILGIDVLVGVEGLHVVTKAQSVGLSNVVLSDYDMMRRLLGGEQVGMILIDPPYANMMSKEKTGADILVYGKSATPFTDYDVDLGNIDSKEFVPRLKSIIEKSLPYLKTKGYLVVFCKDMQPKKKETNLLHAQIVDALNEIPKLYYRGMKIWADQSVKLFPYGYPFDFVANQIHQYILIFRKY